MTIGTSTGDGGTRPGGAGGRGLPERIGQYRITDRIGRGAMGVVYSARDDRTGRPVALKVMMADLEGDRETRERFAREANVSGRMVHRNVINVYELAEVDGRMYMVMELLDGETLNDYMKRVGSLSLEHTLDLMMQVCEGLAIAHAHGVVHRDIKPGTLFVLRDGGLKILDFGVARLANSSMTASGFIVGTPDFMSPEQARGRAIDQRSDVFSAGAVFYYMLSGVKPFAAPDLPAVLHRVITENPPPLGGDTCPAGLWRILMKALAKQASERYADMGQLLADLVRFQQEFDLDTRSLANRTKERAGEVAALVKMRNELAGRAGTGPAATSPFSEALLDRYPVLDERGSDALGVVPFRRAALTEISADLETRRLALSTEIAQMKHLGATT